MAPAPVRYLKLKILHVIPSVGPLRGGPSRAVYDMAYGIAELGHTVHVVTTDDNGAGRLVVPHGQPIVKRQVTTWYFPRQMRFYTVSCPLTRWLARHIGDYDLVHIHSLFSYASLPAALFAHHCGIPYIARPLGTLNRWGMANRRPWLKKISFRLIERRILAHAAAIHYTSNQERLEAKALGVDQSDVVVPLGFDLSPFKRLPPADQFRQAYPTLVGRTVVLFLSRLDLKKGLDLLLPAFANVNRCHPATALVVAGSGEERFTTQLRDQVHDLGISTCVVWTGFLSGEDKLAALAAADLFVLPSYSENFGVASIEALAAGLPVVVSDRVGVACEIERANAGLVVPCEVGALVSALERMVDNPDLRHRMGINGQQLARERFYMEAMTCALVAMYEDVLQRQKKQVTQ